MISRQCPILKIPDGHKQAGQQIIAQFDALVRKVVQSRTGYFTQDSKIDSAKTGIEFQITVSLIRTQSQTVKLFKIHRGEFHPLSLSNTYEMNFTTKHESHVTRIRRSNITFK